MDSQEHDQHESRRLDSIGVMSRMAKQTRPSDINSESIPTVPMTSSGSDAVVVPNDAVAA
jgi:hypothetical protein